MKPTLKTDDVSRRDFGKLTLAAFGGVMAGSLLGGRALFAEETAAAAGAAGGAGERHLCCGLNACKGQGAGGKNDCAGQGSCATVESHSCGGMNDCKALGGGDNPGVNDCKGKGGCGVPLSGDGWKKGRASFEAAMNKAGKKFGAASATCGK
jgi:hypothetical protein